MEELFPVIASLIESQEYSRLDQVVNFCRNKRPQDWIRALNSPSIPNMIFKSALESLKSSSQLAEQFKILRKDLNINVQKPKSLISLKPDAISYALMFKYILTAASTVEEMTFESIKADLKYLEIEASLYEISLNSIMDCIKRADLLKIEELEKLNHLIGLKDTNTKTELFTDDSTPPAELVCRTIDLPEVRTISSKSEGINFIKDSLRQLFELDPSTLKDQNIMYNLQLKLEQDCYSAMIAKLRKESEALAQVTGTGNLGNIKKDMVKWLDTLKNALENEFNGKSSVEVKDSGYYLALLSALDAEKISIIVIQELLKISLYEPFFLTIGDDFTSSISIKGARLVTLATNIGSALQREVFAVQMSRKTFLNRTQLKPLQLAQIFDKKRTLDKSMRRVYAQLEGDLEAQREGWIPSWTNGLKAEVGSFLLALVEQSVLHKCEDGRLEPVFKHCVIYSGNSRKLGVIRMIDEVFEKLKADKQMAFVEAWAMPMLVPPKPWLTITSGGYLTHKSNQPKIVKLI
jgi:DNA-directed RNA polymerase